MDPQALNQLSGPAGRLAVDVPPSWLTSAGAASIRLPKRFACSRCDGGGCDACERSGVVRAAEERTVDVQWAAQPPDGGPVGIRVRAPFGDDGPEIVLIELRPVEGALSPRIERRALTQPASGPASIAGRKPQVPWAVVIFVSLLAIAWLLLSRARH